MENKLFSVYLTKKGEIKLSLGQTRNEIKKNGILDECGRPLSKDLSFYALGLSWESAKNFAENLMCVKFSPVKM